MAAGRIVARTPHFALHRMVPRDPGEPGTGPGPEEGSQALFHVAGEPYVGVIVPKRWAKRAVTRNAIKRQIYAVSSALLELPVAAHVVRLRTTFDRAQYISATSEALKRDVRAEVQALFAQGMAKALPKAAA